MLPQLVQISTFCFFFTSKEIIAPFFGYKILEGNREKRNVGKLHPILGCFATKTKRKRERKKTKRKKKKKESKKKKKEKKKKT